MITVQCDNKVAQSSAGNFSAKKCANVTQLSREVCARF